MMESENFFEQLQNQFEANLPFVAYRKPNESLIQGLLQNDALLHQIVDYTESGFVFAPFDDTQSAVLIPVSNSKSVVAQHVTSSHSEASEERSHIISNQNQEQEKFHISLVQKAMVAIKNKDFQKVVISRKETIPLEASNPIHLFKSLLNTYETAFVYCWYHPKVGHWLGATPETLLQIEGNRLTTMALAGTQKFKETVDVIWQEKEQEEQQFVTDFIVDSLQSSVSNLQASSVETIKAGNLLHLKTIITANLNPQTSNLKTLINNLHPTPAVCGLPKENAKQFILKNEDYHREFYTGFLGELNLKERSSRNSNRRNVENNAYASVKTVSNLYVNLRCMQLKENQAFIYVGGGITKDSIPENEWEETVSKSQVIKRIL